MCTLKGHKDWVKSVIFTLDGNYIVSSSTDNTLRLWDLKTANCQIALKGHSNSAKYLSLSLDNRYVASTSRDKTLRVWDLKQKECLAVYYIGSTIAPVAFTSSGKEIVCGDGNGQLHFLTLVNFSSAEPAIITALDHENANCAYCSKLFTPPQEIVTTIQNQTNLESEDQALLISCPHCNRSLKFNPFFVHKINPTDINEQSNS